MPSSEPTNPVLQTQDLESLNRQLLELKEMLAAKVKKPRRRKGPEEIKYFTQDQTAKFFAAIDAVQNPKVRAFHRAIFRIAYHHGLRAVEVGMLKLSHYRVKSGRIFITRVKGSNSGEYRMPRNARMALDAWLQIRGYDEGPLLRTRLGTGISEQMLDVLTKRYGALAGLPRELCHVHTWKHTCCTHLLEGGPGRPRMDLTAVQDWVGHVSPASTAIYAKITNRVRDEVGSAISSW